MASSSVTITSNSLAVNQTESKVTAGMSASTADADVKANINKNEEKAQRLWIRNLDVKLTESALRQLLKPYGPIHKFHLQLRGPGPRSGQPKQATVIFKRQADADDCLKGLDGTRVGDKALFVRWAASVEEMKRRAKCRRSGGRKRRVREAKEEEEKEMEKERLARVSMLAPYKNRSVGQPGPCTPFM